MKVIPADDISCPICNSELEDVSHLFLFCPYAQDIWSWWWNLWELTWVWPSSLIKAFEQWHFPSSNKFFRKVWNATFLIIVWSLWKERNARVFTGKCTSQRETRNLIIMRLCWWLKAWSEPFPHSVEEVLRNPHCLNWKMNNPRKSRAQPAPPFKTTFSGMQWVVAASPQLASGRIGGFLVNGKNEVICLFSSPCPPLDHNSALISAIHRAVQISLNNVQFKSQPTCIVSSSYQAKQWCISNGGPSNLSFILNFIKSSHTRGLVTSFETIPDCEEKVNNMLYLEGISGFSDVVVWK